MRVVQKVFVFTRPICFYSMAAAALFFMLWKCQFGLDLTDEAFYLAPAWKLMDLGDRLFIDEVNNGPRHTDIANYYLVRPFLPFHVLDIRRGAILAYFLLLLTFVLVATFGRCSLLVLLGLLLCFIYDAVIMPTWSYNWWVRNCLLIHQLFLFLACKGRGRLKTWGYVFAGMAFGLATVTHNPMFTVFIGTVLVLGLAVGLMEHRKSFGRAVALYLLGGVVPLAIDLVYLTASGLLNDWFFSIRLMLCEPDYAGVLTIEKLKGLVRWVSDTSEFWFVLLLGFNLFGTRKESVAFRYISWLSWAILIAQVIFLVAHYSPLMEGAGLFRSVMGFAMGGGILLVFKGIVDRNPFYVVASLSAMASSFVMAMASSQSTGAMIWAVPGMILPFLVLLHNGLGANSERMMICAGGVVAALLVILVLGAFHRQLTSTYFDVAPKDANATVDVGPFRGLRTSSRRAELVRKLHGAVATDLFALAYPFLPGVFMMGNVRSAVDSIIIPPHARSTTYRSFLSRMRPERYPDLIVEGRHHPWDWGIEQRSLPAGDNHPFLVFRRCLNGIEILSEPEVSVYRIDKSKVPYCLQTELEMSE